MIKKEDVTNKVAAYMEEHQLQVSEIAKETKIPESKLRPGTKQKLSASEFLTLCCYLNVRPESFK